MKLKFKDYFNEGNVIGLGYGIVGCFLMWLLGTDDPGAIRNLHLAAAIREDRECKR